MKRNKKNLIVSLLAAASVCVAAPSQAQSPRLRSESDIGWFAAFGNVALSKRLSFLSEFQWRRENVVTDWQQLFARGGLQYNFKKGGSTALLYSYAVTYPYGDYPAGPHHIPEHRITEQFLWNGNTGLFYFTHRLRLEQRFIGKIDQKMEDRIVDDWIYMNRVRYQLRVDVPLNHTKMDDNTIYAAAYDEIFVGFGKNVKQNVFDQNRLALMLGYKFNKNVRAEAGYLNQVVQQGGLVDNKQVFQYNEGPLVNVYFTKP
ncbi:DUF2490 domain-containing protein [Chitinophagaceae bacterium MMS25-I14]